MVYALRRNFLLNMKGILPQNNTAGLFVKKEEAINIDTELDYKIAKMIAKKLSKIYLLFFIRNFPIISINFF